MAEVFSVSGITKHISRIMSMDSSLRSLTVRGELSNVTYHGSGHIYFTMKDSGAQLSGVMFASDAWNLKITLQDGMKVDVTGRIGVYDKGGRYQIYAGSIKAEGQGELYEKYLKLKDELEEKGMFSDQYKQAVPEYIKRLGVVTASTGAAVRDIIQITRRRNPYVEIVLYPSKVQGEGAASSIAAGIRVLDKAGVDVIIVGRGGGSIEDLWAFNEIEVAEAIFNCETPVISAVGHQTDTTIADYVADLRAPTPSAAAELAVFEYEEYLNRLDAARIALLRGVSRPISRDRLRIKEAESRLRNMRPDAVIASKKMRLLDMEDALKRLMAEQLSQKRLGLTDTGRRLRDAMTKKHSDRKHEVALYAERLKRISPLEKLTMGYSFVTDDTGRNVRDVTKIKEGDGINVYMLNGKVSADVKRVEKNDD